MKISFIVLILLMLFLSLDDVAAEDNTNAALNNVSAEIGNLSASIGNASATKDNMTQQQPLKVNDTTDISITKLDEKIIAGNNFTIFLDINSSKEGNMNISLQRNDFKLTFYNQSRVDNNRRQYTINITSPANLDNGLYELSAELNGVKKSQYIFVDKKIVNIFKDKINSTPLIELMVVILIALLLIYFLITNIGIHRAIFLAILVVGCLLILSFIFLDIQKIPFLNLPTYVLVYSFIGALGYVCISWFRTGAEIFGDKEIKKGDKEREDRYRKWSSRLTAAPIIGIIIYYGANTIFSLNLVSDNAIAGLCLISGLFIKPVLFKSRETIFKLLAPNELLKDDLKELGKTDLVELFGPKMALDIRDKHGYTELREFAILTEDIVKKIAKDIGAEEKPMIDKWYISKLWQEIEECGCKISIKEVEKLFIFGIKDLGDLKSNKEKLKDFGIVEENCLEKILKLIPGLPQSDSGIRK